jgi:hypothetical protein
MSHAIIEHFRKATPSAILRIVEDIWTNREHFLRWPQHGHLLIPNSKRSDGPYHSFAPELKTVLKTKGIKLDSRSNGPAVMAFLFAGGERPKRINGNGWPVHHIYDGQFPAPQKTSTLWATNDGNYFTEAAGLVAIHPLADGVASEVPYFAWLLRHEAFERFRFDPDQVFGNSK